MVEKITVVEVEVQVPVEVVIYVEVEKPIEVIKYVEIQKIVEKPIHITREVVKEVEKIV